MRAFPLLTILALLLAGCTSDAEPQEPAANDTAGSDDADAGMENETAPMELAISLHEQPGAGVPPTTMGLDPATLDLMVGHVVKLTITNQGSSPHDLVIEGGLLDTDNIAPGESLEVEFTPTEAGTFRMYCSIGQGSPLGHDERGMHGEVVVA